MPADFTLAAFDAIAQRAARRSVVGVAAFLRTHSRPPAMILRFDVDYREPFALRLAVLAARHGLRGTFYFRCHASGFDRASIRAVARLGHEVGYHYETLDRAEGDFAAAEALLRADVAALREGGITVATVAAHGAPPITAGYTGNLDLLREHPALLAENNLVGDAVVSVDFGGLTYFSDAGWRWWRTENTAPGAASVPSSLHALLARLDDPTGTIYLNLHPQQWFATAPGAAFYRLRNRLGMALRRGIASAASQPPAAE